MPMITKVHSLAVTVSHTSRAKQWYRDTLGLDVLEDSGHLVTVGCRDCARIHLYQTEKPEPGNNGSRLLSDNLIGLTASLYQKA
jgi:catechol-2,3-dioxygenase